MRSLTRKVLDALHWYPDIKDSRAYDLYRRWRFPKSWRPLAHQIHLARELTEGVHRPLIFDIGANRGDRTAVYRRVAHRVVAVEPDHTSQERLRARFRHWSSVTVVPKAVGSAPGRAWLNVHRPGSECNTLNPRWREALESGAAGRFEPMEFAGGYEVEVTSLDRLIAEFGVPCYIKLDIEGYEAEALAGLSTPVRFASFEANLPELREETVRCLEILAKLAPEARFAFARSDGLGGGAEGFLDFASALKFVLTASERFFEVLVNLDPEPRRQKRILDALNSNP